MASNARGPKNGSNSLPGSSRSEVLGASILATLLLVFLITLWAIQSSHRDTKILSRITGDVQAAAGCLANLRESMERRQVQEGMLVEGLVAARKTLRDQAVTLDGMAALTAELQELRQAQAKASARVWLTIGIPTVPRREGADYLTRTLETLLEELPLDGTDPLHSQVRVIVMNNRPGEHAVFDRVAGRAAAMAPGDEFAAKAAVYCVFVDNPGTLPDPTPDAPDPDDLDNPTSRPGREVRKQTCDLITLMETAVPLSSYYLFMEDDFRVCPNAVRIMGYVVQKLNAVRETRQWLAVRLSYGMNGILLPTAHLADLAAYMKQHIARYPPDLLWLDWFRGEKQEADALPKSRPIYVYHKNLLDHLGAHSSFSVRADRPAFPACFQSMADVWSLHARERFLSGPCGHTDLSPCPRGEGRASWTQHPIQWPEAVDSMQQDDQKLVTTVMSAADLTERR